MRILFFVILCAFAISSCTTPKNVSIVSNETFGAKVDGKIKPYTLAKEQLWSMNQTPIYFFSIKENAIDTVRSLVLLPNTLCIAKRVSDTTLNLYFQGQKADVYIPFIPQKIECDENSPFRAKVHAEDSILLNGTYSPGYRILISREEYFILEEEWKMFCIVYECGEIPHETVILGNKKYKNNKYQKFWEDFWD